MPSRGLEGRDRTLAGHEATRGAAAHLDVDMGGDGVPRDVDRAIVAIEVQAIPRQIGDDEAGKLSRRQTGDAEVDGRAPSLADRPVLPDLAGRVLIQLRADSPVDVPSERGRGEPIRDLDGAEAIGHAIQDAYREPRQAGHAARLDRQVRRHRFPARVRLVGEPSPRLAGMAQIVKAEVATERRHASSCDPGLESTRARLGGRLRIGDCAERRHHVAIAGKRDHIGSPCDICDSFSIDLCIFGILG